MSSHQVPFGELVTPQVDDTGASQPLGMERAVYKSIAMMEMLSSLMGTDWTPPTSNNGAVVYGILFLCSETSGELHREFLGTIKARSEQKGGVQ